MNLSLFVIERKAPSYEESDLAIVAAADENGARLLAGRASSASYAFEWCDPESSTCLHVGTALDTQTEPAVIRMGTH